MALEDSNWFQPVTTDTTSATSVLAETQIPEWVSKGGQELFNQAKYLAEQGFDPYGGQRIADLTETEQTALGLMGDAATVGDPYFAAGGAALAGAGQTWDQAAADRYMDPYQQNVTDVAARELNRQYDQQRSTEMANAAAHGAFGGSRASLLETETERGRNLGLSDLYLRAQSDAYKNAQKAFMTEQNRLGNIGTAYGQLGTGATTAGVQGAQSLATLGGLERAIEQQSLDTAYGDFLAEQQHPYQQVNFATGVLKGVPYNQQTATTTTSTAPQLTSSPFGQVAGGMAGLYGAYNLFNKPS